MKRMDRMEPSELIDRFIQAAQGFEEEIQHGTVKKANRNTAVGNRVVEVLEQRGAEHALLSLFDHPIPIVRAWAAAHALRFAPDAAVPVLEDLRDNGRGLPSMDAMTSLLMWKDEDISRMNISELLDRFADSAEAYRVAVEGFEGADEKLLAKDAKRYSARGHGVVEELERRDAEREMLTLLDHSRPIVRVWAARYALGFAPNAAAPVLEDIMRNEDGIPAMEAKVALNAWRDETKPN